MLTGYLNLNKKVSRKYYKGMVAVVLSYVFISLVTIAVREYGMGEHFSPIQWILKITDFSAISYAWYIEMWLGLFLLTPFLNIMWKNIETRRHKNVLLLTMYILCALPDLFNRYGVHLVPGYWTVIYPCAFFFMGAYIRDYQPLVARWKLLLFILTCSLVNPIFSALFVHNHSMIQLTGSGNGMFGMPTAGAYFLLVYRINISKGWVKRALESVSKVALDMYLGSFMFDLVYYQYFKEHYYVNQGQFGLWFFVIVPTVFVSSYCFAWGKRWLFNVCHLPTK